MTIKRRLSLTLTSLMLTLTLLAACSVGVPSGTEPVTSTTESVQSTTQEGSEELETQVSGERRSLTVILDYLVNTNHSGLYVALDQGYFEEEGLDVSIVEPADGVTLQLIAAGRGDIGVTYQEDLTYALSGDEPLPLKAIATIIQNNTSGFVAASSKSIESPADFEGKTYTGWGSPSETAVLHAVMQAHGADPSTLRIISSSTSTYANLLTDIDVMWFFEGWDLIAAEQQGFELNYMPLRDLDDRLNYYTPLLFSTNELLEGEPETVRAFLRATSKGYEYASDPANAANISDILLNYSPESDRDLLIPSQEFVAEQYSLDAPAWGYMKDEVWDNYASFMHEWQLIDQVRPATDYYTNDYLPEIEE